MSLRKYLLISILLILSTVGGATIWSSYSESMHEVEELFDAQLSRSARVLLGLTITEAETGHLGELQHLILENRLILENNGSRSRDDYQYGKEESTFGHYYELKLAFQVWDQHGNLVLRSPYAPLEPLSHIEQGYSDKLIGETQWRVFGLWNQQRTYRVLTAERHDVRMELVEKLTHRLLLPFLLLLPILAWLLWIAVGHGLQPLTRVADEVASRHSKHLDQLEEASVPAEIKPLVQALNRLFITLQAALEKERRFTSDAAHELRTPLAALKTHAQLALRAGNESDREHSLKQLLAGIDRASHVVDQLLDLARIDPDTNERQRPDESIDLHQLAIDVTSDLIALANARKIDISVDEGDRLPVTGDRTGLSILLRNLLDNALRYTPESGQVNVTFRQNDRQACIVIKDSGPGIAPIERERVFERFYRGEGLEQSGCGIGMSIVKQVADRHGATINLGESELGGLKVEVCFPGSKKP